MQLQPLDPRPIDITGHGFGPYRLEGRARALLETPAPDHWRRTGATRELYLDLAERIVRLAANWLDAEGAVIDPVLGKEWQQTTPRFAAPAAVLIAHGRCAELLEPACRAMALSCRRLADGTARDMSPDFWLRELMTADLCLTGIAPAEKQRAWRDDLRRVDGERTYKFVDPTHGPRLHELHNWAVYAAAGEALREMAGLGPEGRPFLWGRDFFNTYMRPQLDHMTDDGMYRDPADPITYDITTRLQFITPLAYGFETPLRGVYAELHRRGCLTNLLSCAADGYAPFGGRSSQFHFQEAILSALFELEAGRYKNADPTLAGAFKRQARVAALATRRWLTGMEPLRHIKNGFDPASEHGIDSYGQYSVYNLLTASFFSLAALFADDAIDEAPTPAELGGYAFAIDTGFHKVFAATRGCCVEIDTRADHDHDATGIGRVHFAGTPIEMILALPFAAKPKYKLAPDHHPPDEPTALGPAWDTPQGHATLAALTGESLTHETDIHEQTPQRVALTVRYHHAPTRSAIDEAVTLTDDALTTRTRIAVGDTPAKQVQYRVPVLVTDGHDKSDLTLTPGTLRGTYRGHRWRITWNPDHAAAELAEQTIANRSGVYRLLRLMFNGDTAHLTVHNDGTA